MNAMLRYLLPGRAGAVIRHVGCELRAAMQAMFGSALAARAVVPVPVRKDCRCASRPDDRRSWR